MAFGLDSRAALTQDGAAAGFGNLGAALLLAPQQARQRQMQQQQMMDEREFRDRQLAQSLMIHREDQQTERDVANIRAGELDKSAAMRYGARQDAGSVAPTLGDDGYSNSPIATDRDAGPSSDLSQALGVGKFQGRRPSVAAKSPAAVKPPAPTRNTAIDPYKTVYDADGHPTKVLKSPDEIQMEKATRRALSGEAPEMVDLNKAKSAAAREQQSKDGVAKPAGGAGVPNTTPTPVTPSAPAAPSGKAVRISDMRDMVNKGQFPDLVAAIVAAKSHGHGIINDDAGSPQTTLSPNAAP